MNAEDIERQAYNAWTYDSDAEKIIAMLNALVLAVLALKEPVEAPPMRRTAKGLRVFGDSARELEAAAVAVADDIFDGGETLRVVRDYGVVQVRQETGLGKESGGKKYCAMINVEVVE